MTSRSAIQEIREEVTKKQKIAESKEQIQKERLKKRQDKLEQEQTKLRVAKVKAGLLPNLSTLTANSQQGFDQGQGFDFAHSFVSSMPRIPLAALNPNIKS